MKQELQINKKIPSLTLLYLLPLAVQRNGKWGLWSLTVYNASSLLILHEYYPSAIVWVPSCDMPSVPNGSNVGLPQSADLQTLLQQGFIPWGPSMRSKLFEPGFHVRQLPQTFCSTVHSSIAACGDLLCVVPHGLQGDSLFHHGPILGFRKHLLCIWSIPFFPGCLQSYLHFLIPPSHSCCTAVFILSPIFSHISAIRTACWFSFGHLWVPFGFFRNWLLSTMMHILFPF